MAHHNSADRADKRIVRQAVKDGLVDASEARYEEATFGPSEWLFYQRLAQRVARIRETKRPPRKVNDTWTTVKHAVFRLLLIFLGVFFTAGVGSLFRNELNWSGYLILGSIPIFIAAIAYFGLTGWSESDEPDPKERAKLWLGALAFFLVILSLMSVCTIVVGDGGVGEGCFATSSNPLVRDVICPEDFD